MKTKNRPQIAVAGLIVLAMLLSLLSFGLFSSPALADTANDETTVQRADLPQSEDQAPDGAAKTPESGGSDSQTSPADAIELLQSITPFGITPRDVGGGGGGVGGGGTWGGFELKYYFSDVNNSQPINNSEWTQGSGATSRDREMQWATAAYPGLNQGMSGEQWNLMVSSCNDALARANQRAVAAGYPANARVVGMVWVSGAGYVWPTSGGWASKSYLTDAFNDWKANGADGVLNQYPMLRPGMDSNARLARITTDFNEGLNSIAGANASTVCIASAPNEPEDPSYTLNVSTQHQKPSNMVEAGSTTPVADRVTASNNLNTVESLSAKVTMHWDGFPVGSPAASQANASKTFTMSSSGSTTTPEFTPADFGWAEWPAGQLWFDIDVAKQGNMASAYNSPDRDSGEVFTLSPATPIKTMYAEDATTPLGDGDVQTANMPVWAKVAAKAFGATQLTITDAVASTDLIIGKDGKVTTDTVFVTGPDGKKTPATITITPGKVKDPMSGKTVDGNTIKATLGQKDTSEPKLAQGTYTLNILLTPKVTGSDFTAANTPTACWQSPSATETCLEGNWKDQDKVTPKPNKVWTVDGDGNLSLQDPDWANNQGADQKVFLHGDKVGTVVNGKFVKNMTSDLYHYELGDDFSGSAKYIDWKNAKVQAFVDGKDVTDQFKVMRAGNKIWLQADKPASILTGTAKLKADKTVQMLITAEFFPVTEETNTHGETIALPNDGWETWNNEKQPTNKPPVFVWNPSPVKDVVGHGGMDGDQGSIEGQGVFPGQLIEYTITPDFNIPADTAYKITKAGVLDQFDPLFVVDKQSVEVFDGRTGKVVGRSNFDVSWSLRDVVVGGKAMTATYMELLFKPAWVEKNVDQLRQGRISVRVAGMVSELAPDGYVLVNQAWQVLNDQETPTNPPKVVIPPTTPDKEDLKCVLNEATGLFEGCDDIDGKTVLQGDKIDYRLTMDARPAASKLAYRVHKLGMVDDYDQAYLDLDTKDIRVVVKSVGSDAKNKFKVGQDVTDQFNLQVDPGTGTAYVFAKSVDTTLLTTGETIPGDPQPADLAAYDAAPIDPLADAGINQDLLGNEYYVYLRTTVVKETDGYTILNQARQNFENKSNLTKVVSNPLKEINPEKDVTVTVGGESINHGEVPLQGSFNYLLKSSIIPTNRAYESSAWRIVDDYNEEFDHYTGQWLVQTQTDLYDGTNLVANAGEVIAASDSMLCSYQEPAEPSNGKLAVTSSDEYQIRGTGKPGSYIYIFESTDPKQDVGQTLVEADGTWSLDYNIARQVGVNLIVEQKSEQSVTAKPTATVKTTVQAARPCYNEDNLALQGSFTVVDKDGVLTLNAQPQDYLNMINTRLDVEAGWQAFVQFDRLRPGSVTNTFTEYYNGIPREPEEVVTETPENPAINLVKYDIASGIEKGDRNTVADALKLKNKDDVRIGFLITNTGDVPLVNLELTDKTLSGSGQINNITCEPKLEGYEFPVGGTINCEGTLTGLKWDTTHTNNATITGESVYTGKKVTDEDPWNAIVPTGGDDSGLANTGLVGVIALTGLGLASVGAGIGLTHKRRHTKQH